MGSIIEMLGQSPQSAVPVVHGCTAFVPIREQLLTVCEPLCTALMAAARSATDDGGQRMALAKEAIENLRHQSGHLTQPELIDNLPAVEACLERASFELSC